eukprot:2890270-Amphidinium_carterae.1
MQRLLHVVIEHSALYNLKLNFLKCKLLVSGPFDGPVQFPDGTPLQRVTDLVYLGCTFTSTAHAKTILNRAIVSAMIAFKQLHLFWRRCRCSIAWKLVVYNAVVRSILCYALESLTLTPTLLRQVDTFFYRGLRRILKRPSTFLDRYWTNDRLLADARHRVQLARGQEAASHIIPFSTFYIHSAAKL